MEKGRQISLREDEWGRGEPEEEGREGGLEAPLIVSKQVGLI